MFKLNILGEEEQMNLLEIVQKYQIIAIFRGISGEAADRGAEALFNGGIRIMEVTMNTTGALHTMAGWRSQYNEKAWIGAGTVLDVEMAREAVAAGAQFLISPNLDEEVVHYGLNYGVEVFPGVMTPTEIVRAWKAGAKAVKLFPMGSLGIQYVNEVRAPLNHIPIIVTGGVKLENIAAFIKAGVAGVGLGNHLVDKTLIHEQKYAELENHVRKYVQAVTKARAEM
jgi:2-dehydro-3-deoxyphosphogluconate aldolase/(4S)-4-hydroxy-2-oxoglutarate aldolase